MVHEIFVSGWILFNLLLKIVQCACHHTGVLIAERLFHLLVHLIKRHNMIKLDQNHDSFFPNHLVLVIEQ